ncbi:MAG: energy transducer TonB [Desulfobacterales bacterium]|nr:energy transducer TonB [Desulfobacterales bacterium]
MKRFAVAAAFAAGLHLLLFSLDVDRRSSRDLLHPSTATVTIVLNAASPGMAEPQGLSLPGFRPRPPPGKRPDGVSTSETPVIRDAAPKPAKSVARKATRAEGDLKACRAGRLAAGAGSGRAAPRDAAGLAAPGSATGESLPDDGSPLSAQSAGRPVSRRFSAVRCVPGNLQPHRLCGKRRPNTTNPAPEYPRRARQLGYEGTVVAERQGQPQRGGRGCEDRGLERAFAAGPIGPAFRRNMAVQTRPAGRSAGRRMGSGPGPLHPLSRPPAARHAWQGSADREIRRRVCR